jgi:hypothetical protein
LGTFGTLGAVALMVFGGKIGVVEMRDRFAGLISMSGIVNSLRPRRLLHCDFVYSQPSHMITDPSLNYRPFLMMIGDDLMLWLMELVLDAF